LEDGEPEALTMAGMPIGFEVLEAQSALPE
jgi:hypothetical protein